VTKLLSRKLLAFALYLGTLITLAALRVDSGVLEIMAYGVALGLPTLLGGQSAVDWIAARWAHGHLPAKPSVEPAP